MISDDERRAVARRLRRSRSEWSGMGWRLWLGPKFCAVVLSDGNRDELEDAAKRLADLIEPEPERTYHPERIGTAYHSALMCSACKYPLDDVTIYCPHCGARLEGVGR